MSTQGYTSSTDDVAVMASAFDIDDVETALLLAEGEQTEQGEKKSARDGRLARVKKAIQKLKASSPRLRSRFLSSLREKIGFSPIIDQLKEKIKKGSRLQKTEKSKAEDEQPLLEKQ